MASRSYTSLAAKINPSVPGCSLPMLEQYTRSAAITTCERTLAWRYEQPTYPLTAGTYEYVYSKPSESVVQNVMYASINDQPIDALTLEQATRRYPNWARKSTTADDIALYGSQPLCFTQLTPHKFIVLPAPDAAVTYTLRMLYALKPSRDSEAMDEDVMNELEDVIVHRALESLLVLPNVSWTNNELAAYHAKQFRYLAAQYRANANLGTMRANMHVKMQPFA